MWSGIGDADRAIRSDTRDGTPVRVLVVEKGYDSAIDEVWHAVTTGERISRWLGPVSGELEPGGRFQVEGNAGGTVLRCEEPALLEVTWEYAGGVSWVLVTLAADDAGTRLRLEHSAVVDDAMWDEFGPGAVGIGWELGLGGLRLHLLDPDFSNADPDYADPGYPALVRRSGDAWAEASIAAGTDPDQARAASERCIAAYTAPPPEAEPEA